VLAVVLGQGSRLFMKQRPDAGPMEIAAAQFNVPQTKKWPIEWAWMVVEKLERVTGLCAEPWVDLIVWPETAVPSYALSDPVCRELIDNMLTNGIPMLVGSMDERAGEDGVPLYFNSAMLFERPGEEPDVYDKCHLVPFGEYIPLAGWIPALERLAPLGWSCAEGDQVRVFRLDARPEISFSSLICFEDAFPYLARDSVKKGARLIINQTNDAWFDDSAGLRQHMAHCVFRCIENRVPAIRVTNTGITCMIDSRGRVVRNNTEARFVETSGKSPAILQDPLDSALKEGFLSATVLVPPADMEPTFYTRHGDVFAIACAALAIIALCAVPFARRMRAPESA
jgi:apolipoprotein N-acyltransferase